MRRKRHHQQQETKVWHDPLLTPAGRRAAAQEAESEPQRKRKVANGRREGAPIIAGPQSERDPEELERQRLLDRVLGAEGRPGITNALDAFFAAGFALPPSQEVYLQMLEHTDEERVVEAIDGLRDLLDEEEPERRSLLEARLRRIAEYADERRTQRAASDLHRSLRSV